MAESRGRRTHARTTQDYLNEIARQIGRSPRTEGRGGSEPKAFLLDIVNSLDLKIDTSLKKERLAEAICLRAGVPWDEACDSRSTNSQGGGTITNEGLDRLLRAVRALTEKRRPT